MVVNMFQGHRISLDDYKDALTKRHDDLKDQLLADADYKGDIPTDDPMMLEIRALRALGTLVGLQLGASQ
jgi:hypothetical protein